MNGEVFTYVAAFGAFTSVSYETPQAFKNLLGRAAYIVEGMGQVGNIKAYPMTIETKNEENHGRVFVWNGQQCEKCRRLYFF